MNTCEQKRHRTVKKSTVLTQTTSASYCIDTQTVSLTDAAGFLVCVLAKMSEQEYLYFHNPCPKRVKL